MGKYESPGRWSGFFFALQHSWFEMYLQLAMENFERLMSRQAKTGWMGRLWTFEVIHNQLIYICIYWACAVIDEFMSRRIELFNEYSFGSAEFEMILLKITFFNCGRCIRTMEPQRHQRLGCFIEIEPVKSMPAI